MLFWFLATAPFPLRVCRCSCVPLLLTLSAAGRWQPRRRTTPAPTAACSARATSARPGSTPTSACSWAARVSLAIDPDRLHPPAAGHRYRAAAIHAMAGAPGRRRSPASCSERCSRSRSCADGKGALCVDTGRRVPVRRQPVAQAAAPSRGSARPGHRVRRNAGPRLSHRPPRAVPRATTTAQTWSRVEHGLPDQPEFTALAVARAAERDRSTQSSTGR